MSTNIDPAPVHVLSLGAGVQSSTMALMAAKGEIQMPAVAIFADTGDEPDEVYDWLATLKRLVPFPIKVVQSHYGKLSDGLFKWGQSQIPCFFKNKEGKVGLGRRQCTRYWKIRPINKAIREFTGTFRKRVAAGSFVVSKGISTDEASRAKDDQEKCNLASYPLIEKNMSREGCKTWLTGNGYSIPPKSACYYCPLHDSAAWAELSQGKHWPDILKIDAALNERGEFLHSSCRPMSERPFLKAKDEPNHFVNECNGLCGV